MALRIKRASDVADPVRICVSDRVSVPFSCGINFPAIVLPSTYRDWSRDQLLSVLRHEFAHIARSDQGVHLMVQLVKVVYWPNPLVWMAARRCELARERACDDFVLRLGSQPKRYALHLVALARAQLSLSAPAGALNAVGKGGLVRRVQGILSTRQDRKPVSGSRIVTMAAIGMMAMLPVATLSISGTQGSIPTTAELTRDIRNQQDPNRQRLAAWWLGEHEDPAGVSALIEATGDPSADVRLVAASALGEIKVRRAIPALTNLLEDDDLLVREMAVLALGEIEDPTALGALTEVFSREEDLRDAVIWALGEISGERGDRAREQAFRELGRSPRKNDQVWSGELQEEEPDWTALRARDISGFLNDLNSVSAETRREAAFKLGLCGILELRESAGAVEPLLNTLRDPVPEVRAMAIWSLDEINPSRWHAANRSRIGR
jgi:hypothetical protein